MIARVLNGANIGQGRGVVNVLEPRCAMKYIDWKHRKSLKY